MIFFGSRTKSVSGQMIEGPECPHCSNQQFIAFGSIRYFHLYWIPTIPVEKTVGIECTHCKKTLVNNEISRELAAKIKKMVFSARNVLPTFSGLFLIALFALLVIYGTHKTGIKEAALIAQPAINDLYTVDFSKIFPDDDSEYKYGVMRIKQITASEIEFQVSRFSYNKSSGVSKDIREGKTSSDAYYEKDFLHVKIGKLREMKESGAIRSIRRR